MIEEKYIKLLLERCLKVEKSKPLFISYNKLNKEFVEKIISYANGLGIEDVYLDEIDSNHIHDILKDIKIEDIENYEEFNSQIWDEYAKKDAAFLMLESEIPHLMDDIDSDILAKSAKVKRETKPVYRKMQLESLIPWCIAAVPNKYWAQDIFPDSDNSIDEFWQVLAKICFLDKKDPIKSWDNLLNKQAKIIEKLDNLKIRKLHYKNDLGTDLTVELSDKAKWQSACSNAWILNIPSFEFFTTPDYRKTEGIVYSSKPLTYNGRTIDNFSITFKKGAAVEFEAKEGKDILKEIIDSDKYACYLGEVAIVNYDSPISNTNVVFKSTLLDENASCHLAFGNAYLECIEGGNDLTKDELKDLGVNLSKNHVDFMIGTEDLTIEAETKDGLVTIMENGNLVI